MIVFWSVSYASGVPKCKNCRKSLVLAYFTQHLLAAAIAIPRGCVYVIDARLESQVHGVYNRLLAGHSVQAPKRSAAQ